MNCIELKQTNIAVTAISPIVHCKSWFTTPFSNKDICTKSGIKRLSLNCFVDESAIGFVFSFYGLFALVVSRVLMSRLLR
jgi:hypothetical protein